MWSLTQQPYIIEYLLHTRTLQFPKLGVAEQQTAPSAITHATVTPTLSLPALSGSKCLSVLLVMWQYHEDFGQTGVRRSPIHLEMASPSPPVAQTVENLPAMWETRVWLLGRDDPLKEGLATHSSILAQRIPRTEEPGRLQSMGSQRVRHDWEKFLLSYS